MEILVLHPGALGDAILSLPALAALRQRFTTARIVMGGNTDHLPFSAWGYADRLISLSAVPIHRLFSAEPVPERDVAWWRTFDRIVSWTGADFPGFSRRLGAIHPLALVAGWRPGLNDQRHVSRIFLESLQPWIGPQLPVPTPVLHVSPEAIIRARAWLADAGWDFRRKLVALHPGASAVQKRWPPERFAGLGKALQADTGAGIVVIEGPAEPGLGLQVAQSIGAGSIIVRSLQTDLLAAVLSCCSAYAGNDSGVSHLAAGLGLRTVVIFGPTFPQQWAPLGPGVRILRDPGDCMACRLAETKGHACLANITCESVLQNLD